MLITETKIIDGLELTHNYSDAGFCIRQDQTGTVYQDALDALGTTYTYTETDIPIDPDASEDDVYAEVGHIVLGE